MLCPGCGKEVLGTEAICRFCGSSLYLDKPPSTESLTNARATGPPGEPERTPQRTSKAIASLVLGIIPFAFLAVTRVLTGIFGRPLLGLYLSLGILFLTPIVGVIAVAFGHRARASIRQSGERLRGERIATAGLVLGYVGLAGWIFVIVFFVLFSDL